MTMTGSYESPDGMAPDSSSETLFGDAAPQEKPRDEKETDEELLSSAADEGTASMPSLGIMT